MKKFIRLSIAYDGTGYLGWQVQPFGLTIQGVVQEHIQRITGHQVRLTGSGRTDAGVHALQQVAVFSTTSTLPPEAFARALNSTLPPDITVLDASYTSEDFHPQYDAVKKRYSYLISTRGHIRTFGCPQDVHAASIGLRPSPFAHRYAWQVNYPLDMGSMAMALGYLTGRHDFKAFSATGTDVMSTERIIYEISITRTSGIGFMDFRISGDFLKFGIEASGFLRHMVRNLVGTLVDVGRGKLQPGDLAKILEERDRRRAGQCAPPKGLFLEKVFYL
ncbi:MAG: tRNA pseudouridine(38-40) synthase TruA [Nitrospirae bacterium]|nr:tRNA pseudouridine(38-40) synthase TruA [Nitrospirota bacterium]